MYQLGLQRVIVILAPLGCSTLDSRHLPAPRRVGNKFMMVIKDNVSTEFLSFLVRLSSSFVWSFMHFITFISDIFYSTLLSPLHL